MMQNGSALSTTTTSTTTTGSSRSSSSSNTIAGRITERGQSSKQTKEKLQPGPHDPRTTHPRTPDTTRLTTSTGASERLWKWGGHGRGVRGSSPGKKFQKLKPIASISGHLVPFQCTVTTMKDFLILQKTKKMLRSGTNITLPREKNSKIEANCKHSQAFGAISVYMDF